MKVNNKKYGAKDIFLIPFKCGPSYVLLNTIMYFLAGVVPTIEIIVVAKFIDQAIYVVNNKESILTVVPMVLLLMALLSYKRLYTSFTKFIEVKLENRIREEFRYATVEKRAELSYKYIEEGDSWDIISRVCKEPEKKLLQGFKILLEAVVLTVKILGLFLVLVNEVWWAGIIIIVVAIPLSILSFKGGQANYEAEIESTKNSRTAEYLEKVLQEREYVEERTLFGYESKINEKYYEEYEKARKIRLKSQSKWFIRMKSASIISTFITIFVLIVLAEPVIGGAITVGMYISLTNATLSIIDNMSWSLTYITTELSKILEYLKDVGKLSKFNGEKEALITPKVYNGDFKSIEFKDVRFKYPNTERWILDGVSFRVEKGKHYAFVGGNGEGKTTITKLITGLYSEYEGEILVDGRELRTYSLSEIKGISAVVYQDFAKYFLSIKENIAFGNIELLQSGLYNKDIENALATMDIKDMIEEYEMGIDTVLGKIKKGGVDISGGQWQKIAMARGIVNNAPLKILDEPTAALDPVSESNIYEKFEEISKGGTTIFISHRLGSTKLADKIFVLSEGKIKEEGSHLELISKNSIYKNMYESQKGWYE